MKNTIKNPECVVRETTSAGTAITKYPPQNFRQNTAEISHSTTPRENTDVDPKTSQVTARPSNLPNSLISSPTSKTVTDNRNMRQPQHQNLTGFDAEQTWKTVSYKKKRREPVFGSKQPTKCSIAGQRTIRELNIFVGGVSNQMSEEDFFKHIQDELNVTPINVTANRSNNFNQSFKLTIKNTDKHQIFNPEMWEENIIIKPFRDRKFYVRDSPRYSRNIDEEHSHPNIHPYYEYEMNYQINDPKQGLILI